MSLTLRTNVSALLQINNASNTEKQLSHAIERLSTGLRVNTSQDDAAGYSISQRMNSDMTSNQQVIRNINDGISMIQAVESYMGEIQSIVTRLRELAVQGLSQGSSNGTDGFQTQRAIIAEEQISGTEEINRIANNLNFNRINLLNNTATSFSIQVGLVNSVNDRLSINMTSLAATIGALGLATFASSLASSSTYYHSYLDVLDNAFNSISQKRSRLGAFQNRLENALSNATTYQLNLTMAHSRIVDVDYAAQASMVARFTIQHQAGVSALAQANQLPRSIVSLLS
jgi:flagellin